MCHDPVVMRRVKTEKGETWTYIGKCSKVKDSVVATDPADIIMVPCGRCPACAKSWRDQLAQRATAEYNKYGYNKTFMLNLTVNDECIDKVFPNGSLDHKEFQKFMKRLRISLKRKKGFTEKIKYLLAGEYGENNNRPHFHLIVYGWKPDDLYFWTRSKKGMMQYRSEFIESVWKDVNATEEDIKKYNEKHGTNLDYLPLGFVTVGDVTEHTAPYIAKYVAKFKDVKKVNFEIDGVQVKKPYLVYPRDMLGWTYFLENIADILGCGHLIMSNGKYCAIPKSWIKKLRYRCEMCISDIREQELYGMYLDNLEKFFKEKEDILIALGYDTKGKRFTFEKEECKRNKEKYEKYRFNNTGKEMI